MEKHQSVDPNCWIGPYFPFTTQPWTKRAEWQIPFCTELHVWKTWASLVGLEPGCGGAAALQSPREPAGPTELRAAGRRSRLQMEPPAEGDVSECFYSKRLPVFGGVPWHSCITDKDKSGIKQKMTWKYFPVLWEVFWEFVLASSPSLPTTWRYQKKIEALIKVGVFFCWLDTIACWRLKGSRTPSEQSYICSSKLKKVTAIL